jgi:TolB-like protein
VAVVAALVAGVASRTRPEAVTAGGGQPTLAVLPLDNLGRSPDDDYVADGLTETLITELSRVPGLRVISRNSVFRYRSKPVDFPQLGVRPSKQVFSFSEG